ncbi:hypothetical protein [Nocardia camponoti]|uniref:Uncharacterized protein n=1 Tax=Nocardia camponoti TaxID=1616106 RepID=A0A917Q988_9NOCA|nr:hypothetical protein [Nocardia camponoti]GGK37962.1 hypothetical protein GCM10011591_06950 [Nocardia camponoti]
MATVRQGFPATDSKLTPSTLVTVGMVLLIPVLVIVGPVVASALIARYSGPGDSSGIGFALIIAIVIGVLAIAAALIAFGLALWRRGATHSRTFVR